MKYLAIILLLAPSHLFGLSCIPNPNEKADRIIEGTVLEIKSEESDLGFSYYFYTVLPDDSDQKVTIKSTLWHQKSDLKKGQRYHFEAFKDKDGRFEIGPCRGTIKKVE